MKTKLKNLFFGTLVMFLANPAFAEQTTLAKKITNMSSTGAALGTLAMTAVAVGGIALLFLGIMGLKKYADDARSNPLMKPIIYLIAGGLMTGFGAFRAMMSEEVTGSADGAIFKPAEK